MSEFMDLGVVVAIVAVAVIYVARRFFSGKGGGCDCGGGCSGCPSSRGGGCSLDGCDQTPPRDE